MDYQFRRGLPRGWKGPRRDAARELLAETDNIGPAAAYYDKKFKKIKVAMPLLNRGGVTPALFRTYLNDYMKDVVEVQKLCDFPKPQDKAETKTETKTEAKTETMK